MSATRRNSRFHIVEGQVPNTEFKAYPLLMQTLNRRNIEAEQHVIYVTECETARTKLLSWRDTFNKISSIMVRRYMPHLCLLHLLLLLACSFSESRDHCGEMQRSMEKIYISLSLPMSSIYQTISFHLYNLVETPTYVAYFHALLSR